MLFDDVVEGRWITEGQVVVNMRGPQMWRCGSV